MENYLPASSIEHKEGREMSSFSRLVPLTIYTRQGCTSRTSVGTPAIEPLPPLRPKSCNRNPPSGRKKIPLYLVLKGPKKNFRRLRRRKT